MGGGLFAAKKVHNERDTDHIALETILKAWKKYQETGDTIGYPFVFVTKEGITITKNITKQTDQAV